MVRNLRRAHQKWVWLTQLLRRELADARTLVMLYVAVVQAVILYWSENWVMSPRIVRTLGRFHHRVAHRLTGRQPRRRLDWAWFYPPLAEAMAEAGLQVVETYSARHQNTVTQYIATRPIMDLCLAA